MERFEVVSKEGNARLGRFTTGHGTFDTPNFMPVGTRASVKGVDVERLYELGTQITLVNTYHLWLRPGPELIQSLGGIQRFCGWRGPILSDSGGYQVFSLKSIRTIEEEGVHFRSHLDGAALLLTPEKSIQIQEMLGVDIAMVLDECPAPGLSFSDVERSLSMTHRWALRSLGARKNADQLSVFCITQGGTFQELRTRSAETLASASVDGVGFDGCAIGGLSVGEPKPRMYEVLSYHPQQLPEKKIRYLMGVGTPEDIVEAVYRGVDLFDCVMPTRAGRFGRAFVSGEEPFFNIKNARYANDQSSLDERCLCIACRSYSRAYIHHLFKVGEMLGPQLLSVHNLTHYLSLVGAIRRAIQHGVYESFYKAEKARWVSTNAASESGAD